MRIKDIHNKMAPTLRGTTLPHWCRLFISGLTGGVQIDCSCVYLLNGNFHISKFILFYSFVSLF